MIRTAPKKLIERSFFSLMLPAADKIVAVSHLVAKDLSEQTGMPLEKIDVIYNPVLPDNLKTLAAAVPQHPWFNEDAPPVVLVVARLEEQKDLFTLIWAFQRIRERKQARLVIFGEGPLKAALKKKIRALQLEDDVDLAGFTSNPYPYMVRADVFALTSSFEGLPTVLIEALALGCPIVSTSSYGGVQEVLPYGQHGSLVPVGDHKAVADAILRVMENGADIKVSAEWLAQFTIDTALKNYIELFGFV
jgi:glycosyltransferase involved in cell wall biosynthesis